MPQPHPPSPSSPPPGPSRPPLEVLHAGRYLRLVRRGRWEYVERLNVTGIVVVLAVTEDGKVLLAEQYRVPLGAPVIELPAGLVGDTPGQAAESLASAARRELLEETGYAAGRLEPLASGPVSAGTSDEVVTFFRASQLRKIAGGGGDATEQITVHAVAPGEVAGWLEAKRRAGALVDPKVYAGLYFLRDA